MKSLLSDAIEDFERFRRSQDIKKGTLRSHNTVLRRFLTVTGNIYCDKIGDRHVTAYFEEASKTRQPQSLRNDHVALNLFFQWCRHTKRMAVDNDPMYGRRKPRLAKRERNRLNMSEFAALLDAAEARSPRDRAAVATILYTLVRDQEAADLRIRDVNLEAGEITVRIFKTGEEDRMPISAELDDELRRWLSIYTAEVGPLLPHYYLLPARRVGFERDPDTSRFSTVAYSLLRPERKIIRMGTIITPVLEDIGFPVVTTEGKRCGEGAHTIRRSGARALFDNLVAMPFNEREADPIRTVQAMLHHKSLQQTEEYIGARPDRMSRDRIIRGRKMYSIEGGSNVVRLAQ